MSIGSGIERSAKLEPGRSRIYMYRRAAANPAATGVDYRGLAIHARAEVHAKVGRIAAALLPPGARVLDLAAGSGAMCLRLKDLGFVPTACDLVAENFRLHDIVDFVELNLNQPLPDCFNAMFDCIVATEIIEHIENPRHLLRQCFDALRPGGLLIVSTPNIGSPASRASYVRTGEFRWFGDQHYTADGHITPITPSGLRLMLAEAGFIPGEFASVGAVGWHGITHWKTRLLVGLVALLARDKPLPGDILVVSVRRPRCVSAAV